MQTPYFPGRGHKLPHFMGGNIGSKKEICETSGLPIPMVLRLNQSNGYIKRSYGHGELKDVLPQSVQIPYLPVRGHKLPRVMGGNIGLRKEMCENLRLPIPMVPCLHQSNGCMKRKLRAWGVQKCISLVGADTVLLSAGSQTTPCHGG